MKKIFIVFSILLFLSYACAPVSSRLLLKNCRFYLADVALERDGMTSLDLRVAIEISNPNPVQVILDRLAFDFFVNENHVFKGSIAEKTVVPPGESRTINTVVRVSLLKVGFALYNAIKKEQANYRLKGRAFFDTKHGTISIPVEIMRGQI